MKKLSFIEIGTLPLLDEEGLRQAASILEQRYDQYLAGRHTGRQVPNGRVPLGTAIAGSHGGDRDRLAEKFVVEASYTVEQVQLRVSLCRADGSWGYPVETVVAAPDDEKFTAQNTSRQLQILGVLLNYQDAYWAEYFASGRETFVTLDWSSERYEGLTVYSRGAERAWDLEAAADRLFEEHGFGGHDIVPVSSET